MYFWHSEGRTARNEALTQAVLQQTAGEHSPWLIASDACMEPLQFGGRDWHNKQERLLRCLKKVSPRTEPRGHPRCGGGEDARRLCQLQVLSDQCGRSKTVEDFESTPHKPVKCEVSMKKKTCWGLSEVKRLANGQWWENPRGKQIK